MVVRYIGYDTSLVPEGGYQVVASLAELQKAHWFEPAGHLFHAAALKLSGFNKEKPETDESDQKKASKAEASPATDSSAWESGKSKKKGKDGAQEQDHYALVGLAHLRYLATEDQIRKAYRDAALRFHPDKQGALLLEEETEEAKEAKKEEIETKFKAIQTAYEVLIDPVKRRNFDSTDEFDDHVPTDCAPEDFFKVFGPVFMRNGRWSVNQPCLMPGDNDTPMDEVDKFYDFWWGFKSWREFPNEDEFELDSAESREHKRWMERQNSKLREKAKKEENARIRTLVENAFKKDPRLLRRKEEEKKEKQRKKEMKNAAKKAAEEEERRAAEEERVRKEEEDKRAAEEAAQLKKQKEKEKKLLRKERARLRTVAAECIAGAPIGKPRQPWGVPDEAVETLCQSLTMEQIKALCERLESQTSAGRRAITLRYWHGVVVSSGEWDGHVPAGNLLAEEAADLEFASSISSGPNEAKPGGPLANGVGVGLGDGATAEVSKAPQLNGIAKGEGKAGESKKGADGKRAANGKGSSKSGSDSQPKQPEPKKDKPWGKEEVDLLRKALTKYPKGTSQRWEVVSDYIGTGRSVEEILRAVKTVLLQKPDDSKSFDVFLQKRKSAKDIASPLSTRSDTNDAVPLPGAPANGVSPAGKAGAAAKAAGEKKAGTAKAGAEPEGKAAEGRKGKGKSEEQPREANGNGAGAGGEGDGAGTGAGEVDTSSWSEAQELALVKAIKAFPKDTENRWERIATAVPGKTKAQCYRKFSSLRESFRSKKGGS